jgi:hypothetical protein
MLLVERHAGQRTHRNQQPAALAAPIVGKLGELTPEARREAVFQSFTQDDWKYLEELVAYYLTERRKSPGLHYL